MAERRRFTAEEKLRILEEAGACTEPGEIGAVNTGLSPYTGSGCPVRIVGAEFARPPLFIDRVVAGQRDRGATDDNCRQDGRSDKSDLRHRAFLLPVYIFLA